MSSKALALLCALATLGCGEVMGIQETRLRVLDLEVEVRLLTQEAARLRGTVAMRDFDLKECRHKSARESLNLARCQEHATGDRAVYVHASDPLEDRQ